MYVNFKSQDKHLILKQADAKKNMQKNYRRHIQSKILLKTLQKADPR
jgi:hypothetical protein